jgi:carbon storage regulator
MLVLSRKQNESIFIDGRITVTVAEIRGGRVRLAIDAPRDVPIDRAENIASGARRTVTLTPARTDESRSYVVAAG